MIPESLFRPSDCGTSFYFRCCNIVLCIRPGASFHFRAIKLNVSLSVCVALNCYIKIRKNFEDSKSAQISASVVNLVSYCVYDVGVSIAATSVTFEYKHRHRCKVGYVPAHRLGSHRLLSRLRNSSTHCWGCAIVFDPSGSNYSPALSWAGRYVCGEIKAQPSRQSNLKLRYGRKICHRNFPNKTLFRKVHDSAKKVIHSQK